MNVKAKLRNLNKENFGILYTFLVTKLKEQKIKKRKTKRKLHSTEPSSHRVHNEEVREAR